VHSKRYIFFDFGAFKASRLPLEGAKQHLNGTNQAVIVIHMKTECPSGFLVDDWHTCASSKNNPYRLDLRYAEVCQELKNSS